MHQFSGGRHKRDGQEYYRAEDDQTRTRLVRANQPLLEAGGLDNGNLMPGERVEALLACRVDSVNQLIEFARLFQVTEYVVLTGDSRRLRVSMAGQHDHLDLGPNFLKFFQGLDAVHARHLLIQNDDFGIVVADDFYRVAAVVDAPDAKAADRELLGERFAKVVLIVYQQDLETGLFLFGVLILTHS